MKPVHEHLALATLAGLVLLAAAAFAITPAHAIQAPGDSPAHLTIDQIGNYPDQFSL